MKEEAIGALEQVRDELRRARESPARSRHPDAGTERATLVRRDVIGALRVRSCSRRSRSCSSAVVRARAPRARRPDLRARSSAASRSSSLLRALRRAVPARDAAPRADERGAIAGGARRPASRASSTSRRSASRARSTSTTGSSRALRVDRGRAPRVATARRRSTASPRRRATSSATRPGSSSGRTGRRRRIGSRRGIAPARARARRRRRWRASDVELDQVQRALEPSARRGRAGDRRQARSARARLPRLPRRRARAARGLPGPREDARRALVRPGTEHATSRASSSRPTSCPPT